MRVARAIDALVFALSAQLAEGAVLQVQRHIDDDFNRVPPHDIGRCFQERFSKPRFYHDRSLWVVEQVNDLDDERGVIFEHCIAGLRDRDRFCLGDSGNHRGEDRFAQRGCQFAFEAAM